MQGLDTETTRVCLKRKLQTEKALVKVCYVDMDVNAVQPSNSNLSFDLGTSLYKLINQ